MNKETTKYRIVEYYKNGATYFYTQIKKWNLFWLTFNWKWCPVTAVDKMPIAYKTYEQAYSALCSKVTFELENKNRKRKSYYYIDK